MIYGNDSQTFWSEDLFSPLKTTKDLKVILFLWLTLKTTKSSSKYPTQKRLNKMVFCSLENEYVQVYIK